MAPAGSLRASLAPIVAACGAAAAIVLLVGLGLGELLLRYPWRNS